jgi:hypothetical protein
MKKIAVILCVWAGIAGAANAQIQFSAGPGAGVNYAVHVSEDGDVMTGHFGALATSQFDMQFSRLLGIIVWVDFFNDMSAGKRLDGLAGKYKISYLHLSPTLKFCLSGSPIYFFGGPGAGFRTVGKAKTGYAGAGMEESIRGMTVRFDLRFGAGYEFFLTKKLTLSPFVAFNAGLNDVVPDTGWQIHALQSGLVLRYNAF